MRIDETLNDYPWEDDCKKSYDLAIEELKQKLEAIPKVEIGNCVLYNAPCEEVMPLLQRVEAIVTDPPYGLSFMGKAWDYDVPKKKTWEHAYKILSPGGHVLAFFGSRTYHRGAVQIEDAGFEIRDQIMWIYGSGFPKSHNIGNGLGTALKPAHEPIVVARKPLDGTVAENVLNYKCGALNIDGCRVGSGEDKGIWPITNRRHNDITYTLQPIHTDTSKGRWPANVIHDGSDEVVGLFPNTKSGDWNGQKTGRGSEHSGDWGKKDREFYYKGDQGSAARFFYCAKASKSERDAGLQDLEEKPFVQFQTGNGASGEPSSLSEGRNTAYRNIHPTVKPIKLMEYLCKLVGHKTTTILDPFMGSGTTGVACAQLGFRFIGIEMNKEYFDIAVQRIKQANLSDDTQQDTLLYKNIL